MHHSRSQPRKPKLLMRFLYLGTSSCATTIRWLPSCSRRVIRA